MPFSKLGLTPAISSSLRGLGYSQPTPVQAAAIPLALSGVDVLARAQTGTGKTAAFGLPMLEFVDPEELSVQALVLTPTRELCIQVTQALRAYGERRGVDVVAVFGGVSMSAQIRALRQGTDIVVATPGRLIDHLQRRTIDLSLVEVLTLDEADRMLDMGFLPALRRVLPALPASRQTLLFSATLSDAVVRLSREFTREPARVDMVGSDAVTPTITHRIHPVEADRKRELLAHVLAQEPGSGQALVFCKTKHGADKVGQHLVRAGIAAAVIHGNKGQGFRTRSLADFRSGRVRVLVATDVAARGLDIAQLPLVVNFDLPLAPDDYLHRVGRTGRAGAAGRAVSLVTASERPLLHGIQQRLSVPLERVAVAGFGSAATLSAPREFPRGRARGPRRPLDGGRRFRDGDSPRHQM